MEMVELLALALAPVVFLFTYVYLKDEYEREPLKYLVITFGLGVMTAAPVIWIGNLLQDLTGASASAHEWVSVALYAFVVVGLSEEGMKYLVLRWYNYPHKEFDEPYDGIMYGVAVSLGFAAIENILYVFNASGDDGFSTAMIRMFTAVPAHAMFGVMMGYFVGKAKFMSRPGRAYKTRMIGLGAAILFHGWYDFFLFLGNEYLILFAFLSLIIGLWLARQAMKDHAAISPHRHEVQVLHEDSPAATKDGE